MPSAEAPTAGKVEYPSLSDYRNYWAILSGVSLGCITEDEARKYLGLSDEEDIEDVDATKLQGYDGLPLDRDFLGREGFGGR